MFVKTFIVSAFLACGALAAPTGSAPSDLEKRSGDATDLANGRCEAHIYSEVDGIHLGEANIRYNIRVFDNSGTIGTWAPNFDMLPSNIPDKSVSTSKGLFMIGGNPDGGPSRDKLTLSFGAQRWNGNDCRDYIYKSSRGSNNFNNQYDWWCQFDC